MIETSESIKTIALALYQFQGKVDGVEKNKANPHFRSRYANLEAVRDTAVPALQEVGIVYTQSPGPITDGNMSLTTMLIHAESSEWMKFTGEISLGKRDPQGVGSALTYMQRYSLMAALGLPPVDDDGEGAMERSRPVQTPVKAEVLQDAYLKHLNAITGAKTIPALQVAFKAMTADTSLTAQSQRDLVAAKDAKKEELQAPNFDNLQP